MLNTEEKQTLDCYDLQIHADKFAGWKICIDNGITVNKCYLLLWYLLNANVNPILLKEIPLEVIYKAKQYIMRRKLYVRDSKRPEDIDHHCETLCGYIQSYKRLEPAR